MRSKLDRIRKFMVLTLQGNDTRAHERYSYLDGVTRGATSVAQNILTILDEN